MFHTLLLSVFFCDGRYHGLDTSGRPEWPPSPARLFQALVSGAAQGLVLCEDDIDAFRWLEELSRASAPIIVAPSVRNTRGFINYVPNNNDMVIKNGTLQRIGKVNTDKLIKPCLFDAAVPFLYAWTFAPDPDAGRHARIICEIAGNLYQLGRGVDMAWAQGEVVDENEADIRLRERFGILWRANKSGHGKMLSCPHPGSLRSLTERFSKTRERFKIVGTGKKASRLFSQPPKPSFTQVPYDSPSTFLLFDIRRTGAFAPQPFEHAVLLTEKIRDLALERLKASDWQRENPKRAAHIERVFVGQGATEAEKALRISITPLASIGHMHAVRSIRRVLVTVPPDCPIAIGDIAWAFSGLLLDIDPETGEVPVEAVELVPAEDRRMLMYYGIENTGPARLWRTVTPAVLPERAARRRIDPHRMCEEAKGGAERSRENAMAETAVRQALRHAGIDAPVQAIQVQREPFEAKGQRAEAFAKGTRFAKERLWHVQITFAPPMAGPLLIGDGRYLGLGLMAPVRRTEGIFAFAIADGLADHAEPLALTRALRRAIMARVQKKIGEHATLPAFFTGHAADGAPARSGRHAHLAFVFDALRKQLLIIAPHILEHREAFENERDNLHILESAIEEFHELRAGPAGKLSLLACHVDTQADLLFACSSTWESLTPYRVTRHAKLNHAAAALAADLLAECQRAGFPRPQIEITKTVSAPGAGLSGLAKLRFHGIVAGPVLLGRDRHFGGGLFTASGQEKRYRSRQDDR